MCKMQKTLDYWRKNPSFSIWWWRLGGCREKSGPEGANQNKICVQSTQNIHFKFSNYKFEFLFIELKLTLIFLSDLIQEEINIKFVFQCNYYVIQTPLLSFLNCSHYSICLFWLLCFLPKAIVFCFDKSRIANHNVFVIFVIH